MCRQYFFIPFSVLSLISISFLRADPPEDVHAWPDAPHGWRLQDMGPRTEIVPLEGYAEVLHVSVETGNDRNGNGDRSRPWQTIPAALRALEQASENHRIAILVAKGVYFQTPLKMVPFVDLYGGFDPATWERDIFDNATILDGGQKGRVVEGGDSAKIDGFIITGGLVRGHGAGIYCYKTSPVITNNVIRNNQTLAPEGFSHDPKRRRQRSHDGGGIGLVDFANPIVKHNLIIENLTEVGYGAGLSANDDCIPQIGYNIFYGNRAGIGDKNLTRSSNGGAISLSNSSRAGVFHNLFVANKALGGSDGGAIYCEYFSWPTVRWNIFLNNYAEDDGGGLESQKFSYPKIKYNLFFGNNTDGSGGAVHQDDSLMHLENNIFAYNSSDNKSSAFGGTHGWLYAVNNTVVFNKARKHGGAVDHLNFKNPFLQPLVMRNNIFYGNESKQIRLEPWVDLSYNLIEGGFGNSYAAYNIEPGFLDDGLSLETKAFRTLENRFQTIVTIEGNFEPGSLRDRVIRVGEAWSLIVDNDDSQITIWGHFNLDKEEKAEIIPTFHLAPDSKCINRGLYADFASDDIDGQPRFSPNIDLGADEYVPVKAQD